MTNDNTRERRANSRRAADWRALFGPPGDLSPGLLADLSPIGVSILSERQFPVGTAIEVHLGAEESEVRGRLKMRAIVRHCERRRIGVHFVNVGPEQRDDWWKIMRSES